MAVGLPDKLLHTSAAGVFLRIHLPDHGMKFFQTGSVIQLLSAVDPVCQKTQMRDHALVARGGFIQLYMKIISH